MVTPVQQANNTVDAIRTKIRRLVAASSESELSTNDIDQYINTFYNNDFPYAIKLDQMRSVYTFFTIPNIDRYPLDVNYNQGVRAPVYFEGIQGNFFKDRQQFFNMWPRWPARFQPINGDGVTQLFSFTLPGPFLSKEVVLGGTDISGSAITVHDDGTGNLIYVSPNAIVSVPALNSNPASPGMYNQNTLNPGLLQPTVIGSVNYITGAFSINFALASGGLVTPASGTQVTVWVSQYQVGRPYTLLFWNNEFTVRPVPDFTYKVEVETYLTPVQFMLSSDSPILNQWWQYIAIGAALKVLEDRQDMEGIQNLSVLFDRQEGLILERQGVEEIGQRNATIFSTTVQGNQNWGNFNGWY